MSKPPSCQRFVPKTVSRLQINLSPYNPRIIDAHARKKLARGLQRFGLVEMLVWNERTGNLVGGHQRLKVLDDLEGRPDYELTVAAVDLDDNDERKLNILLNNPAAQGDWDEGALERLMLQFPGASEEMGFDPIDLQMICESEDFGTIMSPKRDSAKTTLAELREIERRGTERSRAKDDADHYIVLVFQSEQELREFRMVAEVAEDAEFVNAQRFMGSR